MSKLGKIINEELQTLLIEMIDPNVGSGYYAPGLDPKVVKLFEDINGDFYQSTLDDDYWKETSDLFPQYNSNDADSKKAVDHIIAGMKNKYPDQDWNNIEQDMRDKVHGGIT